ncbi:MAG TPA: histidine kinase [Candidatus Limnocylindrales bacterium]|nr:histidine kinase [Candidatus Limnocylindrales bacterium]
MAGPPSSLVRSSLRARLDRNPLLVDTLLALGLTAVSLVTVAAGARDFGGVDAVSLALILLQTLPLAFRRVAPIPVFLVTMAALIGQGFSAGASFNSSIGALVALFTVAEQCDRRTGIVTAVAAAAAISGLIAVKVGVPEGLAGLVQSVVTVFVVWVVGTWAQERRRYIGTVEERAERAERDRETRTAAAVTEERERIARELHDVVSHHVSVIVIQAGAALRALDRRPADTRAALEAIDASGRAAMADMRRMLGILGRGTAETTRAEGAAAATADEALAPMPGLDRLGELLEHVRATGQGVELSVLGDARPLDPGLELAAYRIVQEALTNTLKHAPEGHVTVTLRYDPDALLVEVVDDGGRGRRADSALEHAGEPGRGVIGMVERAALFGGTVEAGRHGRGFRVAARLPFDAAEATLVAAS